MLTHAIKAEATWAALKPYFVSRAINRARCEETLADGQARVAGAQISLS